MCQLVMLSKECLIFPILSSQGGDLEQMRVIGNRNLLAGQLSEMRVIPAKCE